MRDGLDRTEAAALRALLALMRPLPLDARLRALGALTLAATRLAPPLRRRVDDNLRLVFPDRPEAERRRIRDQAARNAGAVLGTVFYAPEFGRTLDAVEVSGPGLAVLREAHEAGRGGLVVSGHFGRWEVARFVLKHRGMEAAGIYRVNNNPHYDPLFREGISESGRPMVPKGRTGLRDLVRHLRGGGIVGMLVDQLDRTGPLLPFLGRPARTPLTAAELALKFAVPMVPAFCPVVDGRSTVHYEAPIPPTDPETMMRRFNDRLGAWIRRHPEQWYWFHRRWKPTGKGWAAERAAYDDAERGA